MKKIIIIPTYFKQVKFYLRMRKSLNELGYDIDFYVYKLSLYLLLKKVKANVVFVKKSEIINDLNIDKKIIDKSVEYRVGQMNKRECNLVYLAMFSCLEKYVNKKEIVAIFIWNGSGIDELAATYFAQKYKIKTLYFEVANIPGKIFVDKKGTNAQSELYSNTKILDKYFDDDKTYQNWRSIYLENKLKKHTVPQKKSLIDNFQMRYFIDILGHLFITRLAFNKSFIKNKVIQLKNNIKYPLKFDTYDYKTEKYIFFPLQVSYDSQIVLNSDINLMEAFKRVLSYARENKIDLVIKPHPQECNYSALKAFLKYKKNFILLNDNTFLLMKYAEEVWTINSTVGLEALIMGKKVKILGKALYKNFTPIDLEKYINGYLLDMDFFAEYDFSISDIEQLLARV